VFQIGNINYEKVFIESFVNILDYGLKYIPTYNIDPHSQFSQLIYTLENNMINLNRQFFLKQESLDRTKFYESLNNNYNDININVLQDNYNKDVIINDLDKSLENSEENIFNLVNPFEDFFNYKKRIKFKNKLNNIGISGDCFKFQIEQYKELENIKLNSKSNLKIGEMNIIRKFIKERPFKVVGLDKNVGTGIISNELYDELVFESLNDINIYKELNNNPLNECRNYIEIKLNELALNKKISSKLHNFLKDCPNRLGSFSISPKIHKKKYGNRPIISYIDHFTNNLCIFLDFFIKPYIKLTESYIQDSQNFIQKTKDIKIGKNDILAVADFESLYSNIDHKDLLEKATDFFRDKLDSEHMKIEAFYEILKIVLDNNIFKYKTKFYIQTKGIAMGSKCGPSIANLYVYIYEKKWLTVNRPIFYHRFIDDLGLCVKNNSELESLKNSFGSLKLNIETGDSLPFLDLTLSKNKINSLLKFSLYIKPTHTFQYLQINSNHPNYIFKNLIKSLFIRVRRICSEISDFIYFSFMIKEQLVKRGYDRAIINKIFTMVLRLDRDELIKYKNKKNIDFNKYFYIKSEFDSNILNFKNILLSAFEFFKKDNPKFKDNKLMIINSTQRNLSSILVHKFPLPIFYKRNYKKCKNDNCNTCIFAGYKNMIYLKENFILPILADGSCNSKNLIYIIFCKYCNFFYIGQTMDIKDRIYKHIYDIRKFEPFSNKCTSVSIHFNLKHHNYINHFNFFVFRSDIEDLEVRLFNESFLINLCKKLNINLINDHIPVIKNYYNF